VKTKNLIISDVFVVPHQLTKRSQKFTKGRSLSIKTYNNRFLPSFPAVRAGRKPDKCIRS